MNGIMQVFYYALRKGLITSELHHFRGKKLSNHCLHHPSNTWKVTWLLTQYYLYCSEDKLDIKSKE